MEIDNRKCPKCGGQVFEEKGVFRCETVNPKHLFKRPNPDKIWCTAAKVINFEIYRKRHLTSLEYLTIRTRNIHCRCQVIADTTKELKRII